MEPPLVLTVPEAAGKLRVAPRTAYALIERGEFPVTVLCVGGRLRVPSCLLMDYLATGAAV